ncbi:MAG: glycoside hydrolase family 20 zincin-like fold domain-containing protein [Mangrovibacterium sp.]
MKKAALNLVLILLAGLSACRFSGGEGVMTGIIPRPVQVEYLGRELKLERGISLDVVPGNLEFAGEWMTAELKRLQDAGIIPLGTKAPAEIRMKLDNLFAQPEGYRLEIRRHIELTARDERGIFYGLQTLIQILWQAGTKADNTVVPAMMITDYPLFPCRGVRLDAVRYELSSGFIKKYVELMAMHKMNVLLWRFHETLFVQPDTVSELVNYARKRGVMLIPETGALSGTAVPPGKTEGAEEVVICSDWYPEPTAEEDRGPLERIYSLKPECSNSGETVEQGIPGILGIIPSDSLYSGTWLEYRSLPGMTALSELLWSPREGMDFPDFLRRLEPFLRQLTLAGYRFHIPVPRSLLGNYIFMDSVRVELGNPWPFARIRYTLDGTEPAVHSPVYEKPFVLKRPAVLKTRLFLESGRHSETRSFRYRRVSPVPSYSQDPGELKSGLICKYYEQKLRSVGAVKKYRPKRDTVVERISLPEKRSKEGFALEFTGYLKVSRRAVYTFRMCSDYGSRFLLGETLVIDHDGRHASTAAFGQVALEPGYYPIYAGYFDSGGKSFLQLQYRNDGDGWSEIPPERLFHR